MAYVWPERLLYDPVSINRNRKCLFSSLFSLLLIVFGFWLQDSGEGTSGTNFVCRQTVNHFKAGIGVGCKETSTGGLLETKRKAVSILAFHTP